MMMKKIQKSWAIIAFFSLMVFNTTAQLPMTRSVFNSPFVPVNSGASNGGTIAATASGDDNYQTGIPIGFTFNYFGNNYSTISASTNGWMSFFNVTSSDATNANLSTTTTSLVVAPWWDDLTTDSTIYILQGAPGNQTFTIQWYAKSYYFTSTQLIRFQVKLHEGSNIIEMHYGPLITGINNTAESASIGIKAPNGGNGNYIDAFTGSSFVSTGFLSTTTKWPARNYRFTPGVPSVLPGGIYNVGISQTYPNIQEAVADVNHRGISGPVTLALTQSLYDFNSANGNNHFPVFFGPVNGSSSTNIITLQPASGTSTLVYDGSAGTAAFGANGVSTSAFGTSNEPIIGLVGSRFINLNNLFLTTSVATGALIDRGIAFINHNAATGTQSCSVTNVTVSLNRSNTSSIGFETRTPTTPTVSTGANSANSFLNIAVRNVYNGFLLSGNATFPDLSNVISTTSPTLYNTIGGINANDIGNGTSASYGIQASNQSGVTISNNIIQNISVTAGVLSDGILVNLGQGVCSVFNNKIMNIRNLSTTSTSGITGIRANLATTGTHELRIYNNFISGLLSSYTGAASATRQIKGIFAPSTTGGGLTQTFNVDFNNISIDGSLSPNISSTCFENATTTGPVIRTRNNIFANFTGAQTTPAIHFNYRSATAGSIGNTGSICNNNDYFIANTTQGFVGQGGVTNYASLANWQTANTQDANSIACDPQFVSNTNDLHVSGVCLNGAANASSITWVTTDIDNALRSGTPDIGADEFDLCSGVIAGTVSPSSYTICNGQAINLNAAGASVAGGITYLWNTSNAFAGPYTPVTQGTGSTSITYNTGTLSAGTYYFVHETTCAAAFTTATSNTVTVVVAALPTVSASATNSFYCSSSTNSVVLTASGANNYTWTPSASLSSSIGVTVNSSPIVNTTYTVIGMDANGCANTNTIVVNSINTPALVGVTANPTVVCNGGNSQLNVLAYGTGSVNAYSFTPSTGSSLVNIVTANTVVPSSVDDTPMAAPGAIGFTFNYNGVNYTQFTASPDGWVMLGGAIGTGQFTNLVTSLTNTPKLYPYWDDLATGTTGYVRTSLIGSAPTRTFVVEWFVTIPRVTGGPANSTFQALLHEATGQVEFRYGALGSAGMSASSGLTGNATNFNCVTIASATNSTITPNDANAGQPANGDSYLFTPPVVSYSWSPSTFLSSTTISNPMANSVTSTTNYSATADFNGCAVGGTVNLIVATPSINASSSSTAICNGNTATLSATGINTYTWNPGPVVNSTISVNPVVSTIYTVSGEDVNNCSATQTINLVVNNNPTVSVTGNTATCAGGSVTLSGNGADTFTWSTTAISPSISVNPVIITVYTVTGTETLTGCFNSATHTVDILADPILTITPTAPSVCLGNSVTLTASGANTYTWSTTVNTTSVSVSPTSSTIYSVSGTSTLGCVGNATVNVNVNPLPIVSITGNTAVCAGGSITLNGNGANTYTWSTTAITNSVNITPSVSSVYSVSGTSTLGCVGTGTINITVNALPSVSLTASSNTACVNGGTIALTGLPSGGVYSGSNVTGSSLNPTATGTFTPVYSFTNSTTGCSNSATTSISVIVCTDVKEYTSISSLRVYPNPNTGSFTIETNTGLNKTIEMLDITGKVVLIETTDASTIQMNISELANGVYHVRIKSDNGIEMIKVIKQ